MICIEPGAYLFLALLLLTIPLNWLLAAVLAGVLHELAHIMMILLFGGKIHAMEIGIAGARLDSALDSVWKSFFSILAGPVCSLLLFFTYRIFLRLALCALIQGIWNLLPVYPLDGGRMLGILLDVCFPRCARNIQMGIEILFLLGLITLSLLLWWFRDVGILPLVLSCTWAIKVFLRKKPCKQGPNKIQ